MKKIIIITTMILSFIISGCKSDAEYYTDNEHTFLDYEIYKVVTKDVTPCTKDIYYEDIYVDNDYYYYYIMHNSSTPSCMKNYYIIINEEYISLSKYLSNNHNILIENYDQISWLVYRTEI